MEAMWASFGCGSVDVLVAIAAEVALVVDGLLVDVAEGYVVWGNLIVKWIGEMLDYLAAYEC